MNIDPIDLIRSSVDESMPHASAERVWARARARQTPSQSLSTVFTRLATAAAAVVAVAALPSGAAVVSATDGRPAPIIIVKSSDHAWIADPTKLLPVRGEVVPVSAQALSAIRTSAYSAIFEVHLFSASATLTSASVVDLFDIKMTRALASLVGPKPAALIQLPNWTKRYGMQVCALPRLQRVLALPARTVSGDLLSCSFFETYLPSLKSSE
ncbi:MAG: hypothetical protein RL441_183 [Actinomycetota bacterium]|jgi:hypothetical protein